MRVLVVEDNRKTASFIAKAMESEGMAVERRHDGEEGLAALRQGAFDAVVMDVMLPGRDGLDVVRVMRREGIRTPVLILSARGEVNERVEGLHAGADDYLPKPFALDELIARVRILGKRGAEQRSPSLRVGDLVLDTVERSSARAGVPIQLTEREFRLLEFLMVHAGRVCTRMMILENVWHYHFDPGTNIVDVYVRKLREKIDSGSDKKLLHSIRGEGYMLREEGVG